MMIFRDGSRRGLECGCRRGLNKGGEEVGRRVVGGRGGVASGCFFIHFYDHIDKVSGVPSLLGNAATLSRIEL